MMALEKRKGRRALDSVLDRYRNNLLAKTEERTLESAGPIIWRTLINSQTPGAWRSDHIRKGSWIIHMLRMRLGGTSDSFQMLGELVKRSASRHCPLKSSRASRLFSARLRRSELRKAFLRSVGIRHRSAVAEIQLHLQGRASDESFARHCHAKVRRRRRVLGVCAGEIQMPGRRTITSGFAHRRPSVTMNVKQARWRRFDPSNASPCSQGRGRARRATSVALCEAPDSRRQGLRGGPHRLSRRLLHHVGAWQAIAEAEWSRQMLTDPNAGAGVLDRGEIRARAHDLITRPGVANDEEMIPASSPGAGSSDARARRRHSPRRDPSTIAIGESAETRDFVVGESTQTAMDMYSELEMLVPQPLLARQ